jgi:hypothetical protein
VCHRNQISQFKLEQSDCLQDLDLATKNIVDAIVKQQDIFHAAHDTQLTLMRTLHEETAVNVSDEHKTTRHEIIREIRVRLRSSSLTTILNCF